MAPISVSEEGSNVQKLAGMLQCHNGITVLLGGFGFWIPDYI